MVQLDPLRGYAVHFTRGTSPDEAVQALNRPVPRAPTHADLMAWLNAIDDTGFRTSLSILWEGFIRPTGLPLCVGKDVPGLEDAHRSACFSEAPLDALSRLIDTRSLYGVGFTQDFLRSGGGRKVLYLKHASAEALRWSEDVRTRISAGVDTADLFWRDTPFVDVVEADRDTTWEMEWRVPRGLPFEPADVAFVFLPEGLHERARAFFVEHRDANTGPAYLGRYLDPSWTREQIENALRTRLP